MLRGIGGNAAGMLGKVLKRGGDDDDDEDSDDDEVTGAVVAEPAPAVTTGSPEGSVDASSSAEPSDKEDVMPLAGDVPVTGPPTKAPRVSAKADIFSVNREIDPALRDLAMSQDAITAQELADDLEELLGQLDRISHVE